MPVDDRWYRKERGPDGQRVKSERHGRGKRWRCRYVDALGVDREKLFDRKVDADAFDVKARAGLAPQGCVGDICRSLGAFHLRKEKHGFYRSSLNPGGSRGLYMRQKGVVEVQMP